MPVVANSKPKNQENKEGNDDDSKLLKLNSNDQNNNR